jgi:DNA repair exonuclease SbcCD nuclease subunit
VLHTNCGAIEGHDNYAPSSAEALVAKGYDYWALGHIHKRQVVHESAPWIVYPGNTQGRHINEQGAKGCTLVSVEDGRIADVQHQELDVVRWKRCDVDATGCRDVADVLTATSDAIQDALTRADGRMLALRLQITGATTAHFHLCSHAMHWQEQVQQDVVDRFDDRVWLERMELRTRPAADVEALATRDDPLGELLRGIRDMSSIAPALAEVRGELNDLLKIMPTDPRAVDMRVDLDNEEQLAAVLDDVKDVLIGRLLRSGEAS